MTDYLDDVRRIVLDEIKQLLPRGARGAGGLYPLMLDYPLRYGKALRPAIAVAVCRAFGGSLAAVTPTAAVLELYHNAFLIHDDIEDQSYLRRTEETLSRKHGVATAINVGDAMLAATMQPLLDNMGRIGLGRTLRLLRLVARMARESAEGQMLELSWISNGAWDQSDADYVRLVHKKTGWYSFLAPAMAGAIVAGVPEAEAARIGRAVLPLGVAFQIQDDVLNLAADEAGYDKDLWGDLWEGKHTLILMHALRGAEPAEREKALAILARPFAPAGADEAFAARLDALRASGALSAEVHEELASAKFGPASARPKTRGDIGWLREFVTRRGSLDYAQTKARLYAARYEREIGRRLDGLPGSPHRDFLQALGAFAVQREI